MLEARSIDVGSIVVKYRVFASAVIIGLALTGCGLGSRTIGDPRPITPQAAERTTRVVVVTCEDPDCSNCNPLFQACQYCDASDVECPPIVVIGGPAGGGAPSSSPSAPGPSCAQNTIDGPGGTFDGTHSTVSYVVPFSAITKWTVLSAKHTDQVNVEFYSGSTFVGTNAQGGTSVSVTGVYTSTPPLYSSYDSTRMTGNWIDHDPAHTTPDTNVTFTATANSFC
jgi:hypothetical protein